MLNFLENLTLFIQVEFAYPLAIWNTNPIWFWILGAQILIGFGIWLVLFCLDFTYDLGGTQILVGTGNQILAGKGIRILIGKGFSEILSTNLEEFATFQLLAKFTIFTKHKEHFLLNYLDKIQSTYLADFLWFCVLFFDHLSSNILYSIFFEISFCLNFSSLLTWFSWVFYRTCWRSIECLRTYPSTLHINWVKPKLGSVL